MTPVESYNSQGNYDEVVKATDNHKNLAVTDACLLLFGNGDGGGGPTPLMLEKVSVTARARLRSDTTSQCSGEAERRCPRVQDR
jgi:alpha-mannosidase